jgi:hypothetical protein
MASKSPLHQCLFCKHLNPAGATFCNSCGLELHLQPCEVCAAIDSRNAKFCYKCGAPFSYYATHGPDPTIPDRQPDDKVPKQVGGAGEHPPLIESAGQVLSAMREGSRTDGVEAPTGAPERQEAASQSRPAATAAASRGMWGVAIAVVVVAVIGVVAYSRLGQPVPAVPAPVAEQSAPAAAGNPAPPAVVVQADAAEAATATTPKLAAGVSGFDEAVALARPGAAPAAPAAPSVKPQPVAPSETRPRVRREAAILKECPQSVAVLGLCSPAQ